MSGGPGSHPLPPTGAAGGDAQNPNLAAGLLERAALHPARAAFIEYRHGRRTELSFAALAARMTGCSAALRRRGVVPGDKVLLFVPMSIELYVALLGVHHAGAVAVFVDAWADRRRLEAAVAAARPRAFVGTPRAHLLRLLSPAVRAIPIAVVARRGLGERHGGGARAWSAAPAPAGSAAAPLGLEPAARVEAETPALITFTTGSTGKPKAAARSHGFLWAQHQVLSTHLDARDGDVDMPTLPVFVLNNLAGGIASVIPDFDPRRPAEIRPATLLAEMRDAAVTTASGSPAFFEALCRFVAPRGGTLPLRAFFTGGAPVAPAVARRFAACSDSCTVLYGSTEAEPIASIPAAELVQRTAAHRDRGLCAGIPISEIEVRIVRPVEGPIALGSRGWEEWRAADGVAGEILVAGRHVLRGYWQDPEADRMNKVRDGDRVWHRTGDGGWLDDAGRLWLVGRVRHRVQRGGATWWGLPVELRALELDGIRHAAYLGVPDPALGQRAVLCVEVAGGALDPEARRALIAAAAPAPVDEVIALERIPRDPRHASKTDVDALLLGLSKARGRARRSDRPADLSPGG